MGGNPNCIDQNCQIKCCDASGVCTSVYQWCVYFYEEEKQDMTGIIVGASVGGFVALVLIIVIIWCCIKKSKEGKIG